MSFEKSVQFTLERECGIPVPPKDGYVNDLDDKGGETKYGISKRSYPDLDIKNLTLEQAKEIYKRDYWDNMHCDELPLGVDHIVFDTGVNSGCYTAIKTLQKAINSTSELVCAPVSIKVDGLIGSLTIKEAMTLPVDELINEYIHIRNKFYANLVEKDPSQAKFLKGWTTRLVLNENFIKELYEV
jgi:lysozyme family protein